VARAPGIEGERVHHGSRRHFNDVLNRTLVMVKRSDQRQAQA
jgi:hypothetical protein